MYQFPKFSKNKVKQAFLNAGGWHIGEEDNCMLELIPNGYKAKNGFLFLFVETEKESKTYDLPIGEVHKIIAVNPWVAVDCSAKDYDNLNQIVAEANACVKEYGKRYKY